MIDTAAGVQLAVRVAGSGPLVILMHGWPELGLSWRHQIAPLAAAGFQVAVPDMRGYGNSSQPAAIAAYGTDALADDMRAIATALGATRWAAIGHDWGSPVAWRCALRFPDEVVAVFSFSIPHTAAPPFAPTQGFDRAYPDRFYYIRYFQQIGLPEAELEHDVRAALKKMFFVLSGDAPANEWIKVRPQDDPLLRGMIDPPAGPLSFMSDTELDQYAELYRNSGFGASLNWYRSVDNNAVEARAYGEQRIRQPAGFLCGEKEIVLAMVPQGLQLQRALCDDLRVETILPDAGHWIQQERPAEVNAALLDFLQRIRSERSDW